jgi:hypothetical protein
MPGHEHVASLGSIAMSSSIADRIAFWGRLHERLAKLSNRVHANTHGKVLAAFALALAIHRNGGQRFVDHRPKVRPAGSLVTPRSPAGLCRRRQ